MGARRPATAEGAGDPLGVPSAASAAPRQRLSDSTAGRRGEISRDEAIAEAGTDGVDLADRQRAAVEADLALALKP